MNINDLTIGEALQLTTLFGSATQSTDTSMVGKYVLVRSRNEGINAGIVVRYDRDSITLKDARRLWYHRPADNAVSWYEGVAISGLSEDSKISAAVPSKTIVEDYSIIECLDRAAISIREAASHEQA